MALTKKVMGAVVAIALILTTALTFAFKAEGGDNHKKQDPTTFHYISNSTAAGAFATVSNWSEGEGDCGATGNKPCDVEVPEGSTLSAILAGKNNSQVLAINPSSRRN